MENEKIIEQLRSGQAKTALKELYHAFPSIRHFIRQHGGNDDDARDIFQEALIILFKKAQEPEFKLTASVNTYLFSISKYMWKDELKKKNRIVHFEMEQKEEVTHHIEEEKKFKTLDSILNSLGEKCQSILRLFYYKKQSLDEIANGLGYKNIDTVKTQKYKCIERAKKMAIEMEVNTLNHEL